MKYNKLYGTTFYGNEASNYAKEMGFLDYGTLSKAFDGVLNNDIMYKTEEIGYWNQINGDDEEINQYFIVDDKGAEIIQEYTNDPLFYNEELNMYVWGITHCGKSWDYVLTDIKLNCGEGTYEDFED